jgi:DNA modification methylase
MFYTNEPSKSALRFMLNNGEQYWSILRRMISPRALKNSQSLRIHPILRRTKRQENFDYRNRPQPKPMPIHRNAAKRYYGVHPYFTKQTWNVVAYYIENYTQEGDLVLDPFGGSGITAIEAMLHGRRAINIDINPMAVFIVDALLAPVNIEEFRNAYEEVRSIYTNEQPNSDTAIQRILKRYKLPVNLPLPTSSDVPFVHDLFTEKQMAELLLLRAIIRRQKDINIRKTLMLMFSGLVNQYNKTCFDRPAGGTTGSSALWIYRYRIAPKPTQMPFLKIFDNRFKAIMAAKQELNNPQFLYEDGIGLEDFKNIKGTATNLKTIESESVDYIYTDPPYAGNIQYLDLSAMWNAWLDLEVTEDDYKNEAIENGMLKKTREDYKKLISQSIEEMFRVLKWDRWLSFVFAHKDPWYWYLITETAEKCGFEYMGAVAQRNGHSNFHERQNPFTVLTGQLIINFRKVRNPKTMLMANVGMDMGQVILQTVEGIIARDDGATLEQINNEMICKGLEMGFLHLLAKEYKDIVPLLRANFDYDVHTKKYVIRQGEQFKTNLPLEQRIRYYLISYLRTAQRQGNLPTLNQIVLDTIPRLKNGITPDEQDIMAVLETIAERVGGNGWRLRDAVQGNIF